MAQTLMLIEERLRDLVQGRELQVENAMAVIQEVLCGTYQPHPGKVNDTNDTNDTTDTTDTTDTAKGLQPEYRYFVDKVREACNARWGGSGEHPPDDDPEVRLRVDHMRAEYQMKYGEVTAQMFGVRISSLVKGKNMLPGMSKMRTGEGVTYKVRLRTVAMELVKRGWLTSADVCGVVRA